MNRYKFTQPKDIPPPKPKPKPKPKKKKTLKKKKKRANRDISFDIRDIVSHMEQSQHYRLVRMQTEMMRRMGEWRGHE